MRKNVLLLLGFMVMGFALFSGTKTPRPASVSQVHNGIQRCITKMPGEEWENAFQQQIQQFQAAHSNPASRISVAYTIPVIVHVVYYTSAQNIPQSQVQSQINTLNADYAGTGLNVGNCPAVFQSLVANTNITFCLAAKDPNGVTLLEPGIDRVNAVTKGFTNPGTSGWTDTYIDANIKPNTIWDPTKYLNIWVLPISGGILGYATFPAGTGLSGLSGFGTATDDGVVINYTNFGTVGTGAYSKGRTASHEIGHWLGLRHISGDSNCGNDYCGDTPVQSGNAGDGQGLNYGCPTYPSVTCSNGPNGDMFMNFMDYTDDACMYMFTPNQTTRMQTALANGTYRKFFSASTCNAGPSAPVANFTSNKTTVCVGGTVAFTDNSSNTPTSWSWTFAGGTPATSTLQNPTVTYNSAGTYTVTLTATNSLGSNTITQTNYITVINSTGAALPLTEGFQSTTFPPTGWTLATHSGFNWERTTVAGGFGSSTASALFNNYDNDATGLADDMISPSLSISNVTNPKVKFDYAYAYYSGTQGTAYDTLQVLIWDVCANTYTSIFKKGGTALATAPATSSSFVPTATQWKSDSVAIPTTFLNKNVKVVFRNISDYGQNLYVDNINIYGTTASSIAASFTSSADSVCQGGSLTFTSTSTGGPFDSIRWIFPNGTPATSTATNPSVTFNTAATITVTLKVYKSGNSSTSTKTIVVKAKPTVVANGMAICNGNTASITATGATTYSWNTGATGATLSVSPTTTTTYTVTGTTSGCTNTDTAIVTVNAKPTVIANGSTICAGNSATITASGAGTYTWNTGATGATLTVSPTVTTTYTVTGTGTNGCINTDTAIISVNALPNVSVSSITICSGQTGTLTATGATAYSWNTGATTASISVSPTTTTTYTVTGTANGCTKNATATVSVATAPNVV
ncbi:MAG TPA: PKD domain-containing protein, partial [Chitinophagales bacterium]|nr:PKD domain-containing protein [Chitinophagales bacterium]